MRRKNKIIGKLSDRYFLKNDVQDMELHLDMERREIIDKFVEKHDNLERQRQLLMNKVHDSKNNQARLTPK